MNPHIKNKHDLEDPSQIYYSIHKDFLRLLITYHSTICGKFNIFKLCQERGAWCMSVSIKTVQLACFKLHPKHDHLKKGSKVLKYLSFLDQCFFIPYSKLTEVKRQTLDSALNCQPIALYDTQHAVCIVTEYKQPNSDIVYSHTNVFEQPYTDDREEKNQHGEIIAPLIQPFNPQREVLECLKLHPEYLSIISRCLRIGKSTVGKSTDFWVNQTKKFHESFNKCGSCGIHNLKLMKCSKCFIIRYCSAKCQRDDWEDHKKLCRLLAVIQKNICHMI